MDSTSLSLLKQLQDAPTEEGWERFVRLYTPLLYRWARRQGFSSTDCDDLLQEIFLVLMKGLSKFERRIEGGFRAWLYRVTVNKCRERQRKKIAQPMPEDDSRWDALSEEPDEEFEEAEYRAYLVQRVAHLIQSEFEPRTWRAFWATAVENRPVAEVAAKLGLTPNAIYLARFRILQRLRTELEGLMD